MEKSLDGNVERSIHLWENNQHDAAIEEIHRAILSEPSSSVAHYVLGTYLAHLDRLPEAINELGVAIKLDPKNMDACLMLGILLERMNDYDGAIKVFKGALQHSPHEAGLHTLLADAFLQVGRKSEALLEYHNAVRSLPNEPHYYLNLGNCLAELEQVQEAIKAYQDGLSLDDSSELIHYAFGLALESIGETNKAVGEYTKVIDMANFNALLLEDGDASTLAGAYCHLGMILLRNKEADRGIECLYKAVKLEPNEGEWHFELGKALRDQGKTQEAREELEKASICQNVLVAEEAKELLQRAF